MYKSVWWFFSSKDYRDHNLMFEFLLCIHIALYTLIVFFRVESIVSGLCSIILSTWISREKSNAHGYVVIVHGELSHDCLCGCCDVLMTMWDICIR